MHGFARDWSHATVDPAANPGVSGPGGVPVWGVQALLLAAADALAARLGAVQVRGELSGLTRAASGHWYFSLKDDGGDSALVRCAMFRRAASMVAFAPSEGQRVVLRGRLDLYAPRGELQMVVEHMALWGAGSLYEEFLRLRARLQAAGLFEAQRKRPLPSHPQAIGVVTSLAAAALRDVATALARRAPQVPVILYPSAVQGAEAPAALVQALQTAAARREVDVLLLVRGGGSMEDLWAFNDERVVRAVAACPIPVVCGVGHETDVTLADLAADVRAATPTAAAELATDQAHAPALLEGLRQAQAALARALQRRLQQVAQGLDVRAARLGQPTRALHTQRQHLAALQHRLEQSLKSLPRLAERELAPRSDRLRRAARHACERQTQGLAHAAARLAALHPLAVLNRGYAWVEDAHGRPLTRAQQAHPGQQVQAVWADGRASAQIQAVQRDAGASLASPAARPAAGEPGF